MPATLNIPRRRTGDRMPALLSVRLSTASYEALDAIAAAEDVPVAVVARAMVEAGLRGRG